MALDASSLLGKPEVAGVQISRLGTYKKSVSKVRAGNPDIAAGGAIWGRFLRKKLAAEQEQLTESNTPDFGIRGYLALSADELALIRADTGTRVKLTEMIVAVPRTEVVSAELSKAGVILGSLPLAVTFANGDRWLFEVPRVVRSRGKHLVAELAGAALAAV